MSGRRVKCAEGQQGDHLEVSAEVKAELDRRLAAHRQDPSEALSWSELEQRVRAWRPR
ncbi:hypothetical protein DB30_05394 [Enhygromyxa salina]|uniref:Addiction module component n=1 Tax=Enhygromyxa salina TaxID=215803 RepID=A0A0C2CX99_9BACT|nr:hypothetical protein DB30_05394 [Enhygromyxa salina]